MNKRFLSNTFWIIGGKIIQQGIGFIVSILTAKYLGPKDFGIIGYITSVVALFTSVANLGLTSIIVKEIVSNKDREGEVIGTAMFLQFISSSITYFLVIGAIAIFNIDDKVMLFCAILQSFSLIFSTINDNISSYYQSKLESKVTTIITVSAYLLIQVYKIILLVLDKSVLWFAAATSLDYLVIAISLLLTYKIQHQPKWKFSRDIAKILLKQSFPFIISGTIGVIYCSLDKIMLKELLGGTEVVGYYNVAQTISNAWPFILAALTTSFTPIIYTAYNEQGENGITYKTRLRQMYFSVFWLGVLASIAIIILGPILIKYAYGEEYHDSIIPSMILTWAVIFSQLGCARSVQIICENKQKYVIIFGIITIIVNLINNYIFIPKMAVTGAAIATLISELFVCVITPLFFKKTRNISKDIILAIFGKGVNLKNLIHIKEMLKRKQIINISNKEKEDNKNQQNSDNQQNDNIEKNYDEEKVNNE